MSIENSFDFICQQAIAAHDDEKKCCVSLYVRDRVYGGPEEGGWWYSNVTLVRYQLFATEAQANRALEGIEELAKCKTREAMMEHGKRCLHEMAWLDARMIDDYNWLGPPTSPTDYYVVVEAEPGEEEYQGSSTYE